MNALRRLWHALAGFFAYLVPSDEELDLSPEARKAREQTQHDMDAKRANAKALEGISQRHTQFADGARRHSGERT